MRPLASVLAAATLAVAPGAEAAGPAGSFSQLPGPGGCITVVGASNGVASQCADGRGMKGAEALLLSPDGRNVYAYSYDDGAIAILSRDPATGAVSQADSTAACVAPTTVGGDCTDGRFPGNNSDSAHAIAIAPDGGHVYAAGKGAQLVGAFNRDAATGALTEVAGTPGCISDDGKDADGASTCGVTSDLSFSPPQALAMSPDGKQLYTGNLGYIGISTIKVNADGSIAPFGFFPSCYQATYPDMCGQARYAANIFDLVLSADGTTLYAVDQNDGALTGFTRGADGKLFPINGPPGCMLEHSSGDFHNPCTAARGMGTPGSVDISPDGRFVVVSSWEMNGIAVFQRNDGGGLTQAAGAAGCVNLTGADGCGVSRATIGIYGMQFSPDGKTLFAAAYGDDTGGSDAIAIFDVGADGTLTQRPGPAGCISDSGADTTGTPGTCAAARGAGGPVGLTMTPDGEFLYDTAYYDGGVSGFRLEHAPACADTSGSTAAATPVAVPVTCSDADGDALTLAGVDGPAHGNVSFSGLTATYAPTPGFSGTDSFRVTGNDGVNDSAPATVTVTVAAAPGAKKTPLALTAKVKPKRDRALPFVYTFSGRLTPAAGTTCSGSVRVTLRKGRKTIARKSGAVASSCAWRVRIKIRSRKKLGRKRTGSLKATPVFSGNASLTGLTGKTVRVRYG
jgi:6-phosphogluconolactonase (cycloisomerase 2 family)